MEKDFTHIKSPEELIDLAIDYRGSLVAEAKEPSDYTMIISKDLADQIKKLADKYEPNVSIKDPRCFEKMSNMEYNVMHQSVITDSTFLGMKMRV